MQKLLLLLGLAAACSHDAPAPVLEPGEKQPLPPASGTPIGFLIDDATDLSLSPEQLAQLQGIDLGLQARLDALDKGAPRAQPTQQAPQQGGRHRGGGGRHRQQQQQPPAQQAGSGSAGPLIAQQSDAKRGEVKSAVQKALALLDVPQRILARKLLADHDVDWDDSAKPAPAATDAEGETGEP